MFSFFEMSSATEHARSILASIATLGLTSPQPQSIRGSLKFGSPNNELCYNQINLINPNLLDETVKSLVYDEKEGCWAIACERKFADKRLPAYQISEALINSIVFLFSREGMIFQKSTIEVKVYQWPNQRLWGTSTDINKSYFQEVRLPGKKYSIPSSAFKAILAPLHLVHLVKEAFPQTSIIPVTLSEAKFTEDPIELFIAQKSVINQSVIGPNYERAIHIALAENPQLNQLGVHITRLPSVYQPNTQLSIKDNQDFYQKKWNTITLRLKNPAEKQLSDISQLSGVLVFKESRSKGSSYLCLCPKEQREAIAALMQQDPNLMKKNFIGSYNCNC